MIKCLFYLILVKVFLNTPDARAVTRAWVERVKLSLAGLQSEYIMQSSYDVLSTADSFLRKKTPFVAGWTRYRSKYS